MPLPPFPEALGILLIEPDAEQRALLRSLVEKSPTFPFHVSEEADSLESGLPFLESGKSRLILLALGLPGCRGVEAFSRTLARAPHLPIIILSAPHEEELALETIHLGAQEYLVKGSIDAHLLLRTLRYAVERFRSEQALARERELLSTLLENIPDRIYFKDQNSRFIRVNRAMTKLFHLNGPEETYGRSDADFFDANHARESRADEQRVMESGEAIVEKVEKKILADGSRLWSLTTKLPLRDHEGRIVGTCGISREITRLKEMEEQLATDRNLLRAVIDNLPDLIFLKGIDGKYMLSNAAYAQWVGVQDSSEVVGRTVREFFPDDYAAAIEAEDAEVFRGGQILVNQERLLINFEGGKRWGLVTKAPWHSEEGAVLGLVFISRDITDKRMSDENLKQAYADVERSREEVLGAMAKLQSAHKQLREVQLQLIEAEKMKTVGRLAAGVAHEVKNPLAVLKMGLEYLNATEIPDANAGVILHEMSEAVQRADTVIRGLLDFSAPTRLELQPANLNAVIEDALRYVGVELQGNFQVITEFQKRLPEVRVDAAKLSQTFVNLLTNAIHAMEGGGILTVRTYSRQLTGIGSNIAESSASAFRVGETIVVAEVEDTGPGIPDDKLSKIFEPFFTTKPTGKGTGLGLSVVKTIIDLHGGAVDMRNLPDRGLRVTITLAV